MIIHNVKQGTPEWKALRAAHDTASEASAMMGASKSVTRNEMLHAKATGNEQQFTDFVEKRVLPKGHLVEAQSLPLAQEIIGKELFPVTATSEEYPRLLISLDGITMYQDVTWECKQWNEEKAEYVRHGKVPPEDIWQTVQHLVVSRASKCLYMVSKDGTRENSVWCWITLEQAMELEDQLIRGWAQFNRDRDAYTPAEVVEEVVAASVTKLPALTYKVDPTSLAVTSSLDAYKVAASRLLADAKKELNTDQDFADRKAMNKELRTAEERMKILREQVLGEIKDVDQFTRELGEMQEIFRQAALVGEKQVTQRETAIKNEHRDRGIKAFQDHIDAINLRLAPVQIPVVAADFQTAIKNKRTIASLVNSVDTELARVKILADAHADKITANLATMRTHISEDLRFLFRDVQELALKDGETLMLIINQRLADHKLAEEKRLEAIREEERQKLIDEQAERDRLAAAPDPEQATAAPITVDPGNADCNVVAVVETAAGGEIESIKKYSAAVPIALQVGSGESTSRIAIPQADRFELTNMLELVRAVARGAAPIEMIKVDMDQVAMYCQHTGEVLPGVTWTKE